VIYFATFHGEGEMIKIRYCSCFVFFLRKKGIALVMLLKYFFFNYFISFIA